MSQAIGLRPEQLDERAAGLGASDVPTIFGLNPWKHPPQLAAEKRGEFVPEPAGEAALWGQRFERPIADEWIARRRAEGHEWAIFTPPTIHHPRSAVLMATLDRIVVPVGRRARSEWIKGLEVKNLSAYRREEFGAAEDEIPDAILVQVQAQLEVTGLPEASLAVVLGGQKYQERTLLRDQELGGLIVQTAEQWWADHVVQGLPVPVDGSASCSEFLRRRFPRETGPVVPATPPAAAIVARLREAKEAAAQAEAFVDEASNELRALMGNAAGIEGLCSWKANRDSTKVDWETVARQMFAALAGPMNQGRFDEIVAANTTTKPGSRVLRLLTPKGTP